MEAKVLGICGSTRIGATDYAVRKALEAAESVPGIKTEYIALNKKKISPCIHCDNCLKKNCLCTIKDDFQEIQDALLSADGIILGSSVYCMNTTPFILNVMSRMRPTYLLYPGHFAHKVGGAIAVGGTRHGGQETALRSLISYMQTYELVITGGPGGNYIGATVWSEDKKAEGARADTIGMQTVVGLGRRVAELVLILKAGKEQVLAEGIELAKPGVWFQRD